MQHITASYTCVELCMIIDNNESDDEKIYVSVLYVHVRDSTSRTAYAEATCVVNYVALSWVT